MNLPLIVFLLVLVLTFIIRIPIPIGFFVSTVLYLLLAGIDVSIASENIVTNLYSSYIVIAVPLFIFTANIMNSGTVTEKVFRFASGLVGGVRGSLAQVNILASLIFSGMSGSALADASGLGLMELKAMREEGYEDGFTTAITAASSTIGPIFPPSIPMVFYSMLSGASVGMLFLGGMVPGIFMALALMIYVAAIAKRRNFPRSAKFTIRQFVAFTWSAAAALITPVILLGGIYTGVFTPTEAGAIAALYSLAVSFFIYKTIGLKELLHILLDTVKSTGTLSIIVGTSFGISFVLSREGIPLLAAQFILNFTQNKFIFLFFVNVIFLVLGMFMNVTTIQLVFIPIILPMLASFNIDLVHFGVFITLNIMIGLTTPPYGGLLFVVNGISGCPMQETIKELIPMQVVLIIVLFMMTYIPGIVLWLPRLFGYGG